MSAAVLQRRYSSCDLISFFHQSITKNKLSCRRNADTNNVSTKFQINIWCSLPPETFVSRCKTLITIFWNSQSILGLQRFSFTINYSDVYLSTFSFKNCRECIFPSLLNFVVFFFKQYRLSPLNPHTIHPLCFVAESEKFAYFAYLPISNEIFN